MTLSKDVFKNKKFYYRRALWDEQGEETLQDLIVNAYSMLDTVGKRTFSVPVGAEIRGASYKNNDGLYLQIASYVPDEATSIIDKDKTAKESKIDAQIAPAGKDYLDGDVFVYVKDNDVILCPSGAREKVVQTYIWNLLRATDEKEIAVTFELDKVAKASKLKMISDEGVKEIDLDASLYDASLVHMDKTKPKVAGIKRVVAEQFLAIFGKDKELKDIKEQENLNVRVTLRFDGNEARKHSKDDGFGDIGKKRLEKTAQKIIAEYESDKENGFVIITGKNNRITSEEIRVSDSFKVKVLGKSLSKESAWSSLKSYYDRLKADGVFNQ